MSRYQPSVTLHQQDGGMSLQAFAEKQGISEAYLRWLIKRGLVLGASKHPLSKKWCIYPPARIADGSCSVRPTIRKRREPAAARGKLPPPAGVACAPAAGFSTGSVGVVDVGTSPHGLSADGLLPVHETCEASSLAPPAKPVLAGVEVSAAPGESLKTLLNEPVLPGEAAKWRYNGFEEREQREGCALSRATPEHCACTQEAKRVRQVLQEAAARVHREGIHYLHLDSREFSQLYAALDHERSRIRKLVGKGLVDVGNLRASDSVWQKLQAMCREGRLL